MKILGLQLPTLRKKSADDISHFSESEGGWWPIIREGFAGAWQQNVVVNRETILAFTTVYACITRISTDIGKMPLCLLKKTGDGIWVELTRASPYIPVLKKPNSYQTRAQFIRQWLISKLINGNTYVLKVRDQRGIVTELFILDPTRVTPLITPRGDIYYQLGMDALSGLTEGQVTVPASEIIHDRMPGFFHPLIGTSPIFACALAASQGHNMQKSSAAFFKNMANPAGVLTAPGAISDATAARLKTTWTEKFTGKNFGAVAVLGDGLKWEAMTMSSVDAQLIEQLKWAAETVCSAFDMPPFMVGVGPPPTYTNIEALTQLYYSQCLQKHIEDIECGLDEGLGIANTSSDDELTIKFNLDNLLRMDTKTRFETWKEGISGGFIHPNWARLKENLPPVEGGDVPYMQQQNYGLPALAKRDAMPIPTTPTKPAGTATDTPPAADDKPPADDGYPKNWFMDTAKEIAGKDLWT